jgi:hypothetical protein
VHSDPLVLASRLYKKKVIQFQKELHDMREDVFQTFATKSVREIRHYYDLMAGPQRRIANWGAINFGLLRLFLLGIFLLVLYIAIDIDDFTKLNNCGIGIIIKPIWRKREKHGEKRQKSG